MEVVKAKYSAFVDKWSIKYPLHSHEIRHKTKNFSWLKSLSDERLQRFMGDVGELATAPELTVFACVVDRPGYNHRYLKKYGRRRWSLCKTSFSIVVERAAKFARGAGCRLRVFVEKSDPETDRNLRCYYDAMRVGGHPFNNDNAAKYKPLSTDELHDVLYDFKTKAKSSPPIQLADLCLWPVCMGGYDQNNIPYLKLREAGTLIDCKLSPEEIESSGIKYSCWDLVALK